MIEEENFTSTVGCYWLKFHNYIGALGYGKVLDAPNSIESSLEQIFVEFVEEIWI